MYYYWHCCCKRLFKGGGISLPAGPPGGGRRRGVATPGMTPKGITGEVLSRIRNRASLDICRFLGFCADYLTRSLNLRTRQREREIDAQKRRSRNDKNGRRMGGERKIGKIYGNMAIKASAISRKVRELPHESFL